MERQFSVVVATLNRGPLLGACLDSIAAQDFADFEIIVVDGGSTDNTVEVLARYGDRVRVVEERGTGPGGARNLGARTATGRYLVFVDSDDMLRAGALSLYADALHRHGDPPLLLAAFHPFDTPAEAAALQSASTDAPVIQQYADYLRAAEDQHLIGTHRLVIDRRLFLAAGGLTPGLLVCEDQDFGLRINDRGPCLVVHQPATVLYRLHEGNISGNMSSFHRGAMWLIGSEKNGAYPGGRERAAARQVVITRTARSTSLGCLKQRYSREALMIYRATLAWHVRMRRWKYLFGFPIQWLGSLTRAAAR